MRTPSRRMFLNVIIRLEENLVAHLQLNSSTGGHSANSIPSISIRIFAFEAWTTICGVRFAGDLVVHDDLNS